MFRVDTKHKKDIVVDFIGIYLQKHSREHF